MAAQRPSIFKQHFEQTLAQKQQQQQLDAARKPKRVTGRRIEPLPVAEPMDATAQNIELRFHADMQRIKQLKSIDARIALKADMLPNYHGWIDGILAVANPNQNDMLMHLMVWNIDVGDYELALRIGEYALLNGYVMPEPYTRSVASILAAQISEGLLTAPEGIAGHLPLIERLVELTNPEDMVDQIRAKVHKCLGLALQVGRPKESLAAFESAKRLNKQVGVTPQINKLRKQLNSQAVLDDDQDDESDDTESSRDAPSGSQDTAETSDVSTADPASTAPLVNTGA